MLPIAIVNNSVPVPIVNTTVPGTAVTHVPYDNVAPSISSAQVNNNASSNSGAAAAAEEQAQTTQADVPTQEEATAINNAAQSQAPSAQATFLAQLLSQDGSPAAQTILVQYEKLIALSNVKYKPSNAFKPVPAPSGTFGKLLQENRPVAATQLPATAQPPRPQVPQVAPTEEIISSAAVATPPPRQPAPRNLASYTTPGTDISTAPQINAYTSTATRVDTHNEEVTTELA